MIVKFLSLFRCKIDCTPILNKLLAALALMAKLLRKVMGNESKPTPEELWEMVRNGDINDVKLLLGKGADINTKDNDGWTALHYATRHQTTEMAQLLLDRGADINAKDNDGWTALHCAAVYKNTEMVQLLLDKGADVNAKTDIGKDALNYARENKNQEMEQLLLQQINNKKCTTQQPNPVQQEQKYPAEEQQTQLEPQQKQAEPQQLSQWDCVICTYLNSVNDEKCQMCQQGIKPAQEQQQKQKKPAQQSPKLKSEYNNNDVIYFFLKDFDMFVHKSYNEMITALQKLDENDLQNSIGIENEQDRKIIMLHIEKSKKK